MVRDGLFQYSKMYKFCPVAQECGLDLYPRSCSRLEQTVRFESVAGYQSLHSGSLAAKAVPLQDTYRWFESTPEYHFCPYRLAARTLARLARYRWFESIYGHQFLWLYRLIGQGACLRNTK